MGAHGTLQEALDSVAAFAEADQQQQLDKARAERRNGKTSKQSSKKKHKKDKDSKKASRKKVSSYRCNCCFTV